MAFRSNGHRVWLVVVAMLLVSGCNTLFDGPAGSDALDGLSEQALSDVQAIAKSQSSREVIGALSTSPTVAGLAQEGVSSAVQAGSRVAAHFASAKVTRISAAQAQEPTLYFEKISNPMPQLVMLSTGRAAVWWDDKPLLMPAGNASHVVLVQPGKHTLKIEYANAAVFKAEIVVARFERVTLRVDAMPGLVHQDNQ